MSSSVIKLDSIYIHDATGVMVFIEKIGTNSGTIVAQCSGVDDRNFRLKCPLKDLTKVCIIDV